MAEAGGIFVAVGHDGLRMTSPDGVRWENVQKGREGEVFHTLVFGAGGCLAVGRFGGSNLFAFTRDGVTWNQYLKDARYAKYLLGVTYANGVFLGVGGEPVTVGASSPFVMESKDGENWTEMLEISGKNVLRRLAWGNGRWVGVGDRGRRATSRDGRTWDDVPDVKALDTLVDLTFGNGVFVGVGLHGLRMTSRDGVNWDRRFTGEEGEHLNSICWTGKQFVAVGQGATYFSPDGLAWQRRPSSQAPLTAAYGPGFYLGAHWKGRILKSTDAVQWEAVHKAGAHVEAVGYWPSPSK